MNNKTSVIFLLFVLAASSALAAGITAREAQLQNGQRGILPFPEDTLAYNERFNNRQWIDFDSQGRLHVTYTGQFGTAGNTREIYYARESEQGFVTTALTQNTTDDNFSVFVFDENDVMHLVFLQYTGAQGFQLMYMHNTGGAFSDPVQITTGTNKAPAYIGIDSDQVVHFVYHSFISGQPDHAWYTWYDRESGTIGSPVQLAQSDAGSEHEVRLVVDSQDVVHIVMRDGSLFGGLLRYYNNSSGQIQEYALPESRIIDYPAMAIGHDDRLHVIYRIASSRQVHYISRDSQGNWSDPVAATGPEAGNPVGYRSIGVDEQGRLYFSFQNSWASAERGFFLVHGLDGVFSEPILVWDDPLDVYLTRNSNSVAARGEGEIAVVYAPAMARGGEIVCDLFMKRGNIFDEPEALISANPMLIDFGEAKPYGEAVYKDLTVSNTGMAPLLISEWAHTLSGFSIMHNELPDEIAPGQSLTISVAFFPFYTGEHTGAVYIESNAANYPQLTIALTGYGRPFYIEASAGQGGSISPEGLIEIPDGSSLNFEIEADTDYIIAEMLLDGQAVEEAAGLEAYSFLLESIYDDHQISVSFQSTVGIDSFSAETWQPAPNPATEYVYFLTEDGRALPILAYQIYDLQARLLVSGKLSNSGEGIPVGRLLPGSYLMRIILPGHQVNTIRFEKQ